jgi:hypothetical protein
MVVPNETGDDRAQRLAAIARKLVDELGAGKHVRAELEAAIAALADEIDGYNEHGAGAGEAGEGAG